MTVYEDLVNRRDLLIQAATRCALAGKTKMSDMWCKKALEIIAKMSVMTLEQADERK